MVAQADFPLPGECDALAAEQPSVLRPEPGSTVFAQQPVQALFQPGSRIAKTGVNVSLVFRGQWQQFGHQLLPLLRQPQVHKPPVALVRGFCDQAVLFQPAGGAADLGPLHGHSCLDVTDGYTVCLGQVDQHPPFRDRNAKAFAVLPGQFFREFLRRNCKAIRGETVQVEFRKPWLFVQGLLPVLTAMFPTVGLTSLHMQ